MEIPLEVFVETLTNALIHRDYYINAPIRLFIFDNRIEIHSPGTLPDSVTEETIKQGISVPRNQLLFDNARHLLPYTGIGSGIMRAMQSYGNIKFQNNIATQEFVITILRDETIEDKVDEGIKSELDGINNKNERINDVIEQINFENERINNVIERINFENKQVNEAIKKEIAIIFLIIEQYPLLKIEDIGRIVNKSNASVRRYLKTLKDNNLIEYAGAKKTGGYKIINSRMK